MQEHKQHRESEGCQDTPFPFSVRSVSNEFDVLAEKFFGPLFLCVILGRVEERSHNCRLHSLQAAASGQTMELTMQLTFMGFFRSLPFAFPPRPKIKVGSIIQWAGISFRFSSQSLSLSQTIHNKLQINRQWKWITNESCPAKRSQKGTPRRPRNPELSKIFTHYWGQKGGT